MTPHEPSLEELYLRVRQPVNATRRTAPGCGRSPATTCASWAGSPDFWAPMLVLAALFFVVIPVILLLTITNLGSVPTVQKVSAALDLLPQRPRPRYGATAPPTAPPTPWPSTSSPRWP